MKFTEYQLEPRNHKIADACFKSGYIDAWGRGTLKIIEACKEAGLPEPEILEKDGEVQVTLVKAEDAIPGGQMGGQISGQIETLPKRQAEVLQMIFADPKISRKALALKMGINESAVQKHLRALTLHGAVKRVGTRDGYWNILWKE
jgi:ATP-dependent DNA helicase RecG